MKFNWSIIHESKALYQKACWKSCNSYCCNFSMVYENFSYVSKKNILIFFPGEYEFLDKNGLLQENFKESHKQIYFHINKEEFYIDTVSCTLNGKCTIHTSRPIICKLYPFFPIVDIQGRITGFNKLAPVDMFWEILKIDTKQANDPCTIRSLNISQVNRLTNIVNLLCKNPINIFYIMLANIYKRTLYQEVVENVASRELSIFFSSYELESLSSHLFDKINTQASDLLTRFDNYYGIEWNKKQQQYG